MQYENERAGYDMKMKCMTCGKDIEFTNIVAEKVICKECNKIAVNSKYGIAVTNLTYIDTDSAIKYCKTCDNEKRIFSTYDEKGNIVYVPCAECCKENEVRPSHYQGNIECIEAIKEVIKNLDGKEGFYIGNTIKYLWRWKEKNGVEDLKKAATYLEWLINDIEKEK